MQGAAAQPACKLGAELCHTTTVTDASSLVEVLLMVPQESLPKHDRITKYFEKGSHVVSLDGDGEEILRLDGDQCDDVPLYWAL